MSIKQNARDTKSLNVNFYFPKLKGLFFLGQKEIFIFGSDLTIQEVIDTLNHEYIHYVVEKMEGSDASLCFDVVAIVVKYWDNETYGLLY